MYNREALEANIEKCKANIKIFEEAIEKEYKTISELRDMAETIDRKIREKEEAVARVHIEIDDGG